MPLTPEQRSSLWEPQGSPFRGHRIVSARPGTGKTTTVTEYCIDLASDWSVRYSKWQGMGVVSYTNVAKDELEAKIRTLGKANCLLSSPHFVGTIDAFLNQYVFLPFGASYMGYSDGRPKLVGEPYRQWGSINLSKGGSQSGAFSALFFDCYSLDVGGVPVRTSARPLIRNGTPVKVVDVSENNSPKILKMKHRTWAAGYALQCDANFIAYATLIESASLTQSLIERFPVLVIDEAQDLTQVQHAIVDHLKSSGQKHILLVGDEYQAIYEWNTAKPQLFVDKTQAAVWNPKTVSATFRCGEPVCDVLTNMASDGKKVAPASGARNATYRDPVQVVAYEKDSESEDIKAAIDDLAKRLADKRAHDGNASDLKALAVLGRSKQHVAALQALFTDKTARPGRPIEWGYALTKDYLRVVNALLRQEWHEAISAYEILMYNSSDFASKNEMRRELSVAWGASSGSLAYRGILFADLEKLVAALLQAGTDMAVSECGVCCDVRLRGINPSIMQEVKTDCASFRSSAKRDQDTLLSALFMGRNERVAVDHPDFPSVRLAFSTVHGVKGETYDGVLFYTKARTSACGCAGRSTTQWDKILTHPLVECELKRIAYVALSRAAQLLHISAPAGSEAAWRLLTETSSKGVGSQ